MKVTSRPSVVIIYLFIGDEISAVQSAPASLVRLRHGCGCKFTPCSKSFNIMIKMREHEAVRRAGSGSAGTVLCRPRYRMISPTPSSNTRVHPKGAVIFRTLDFPWTFGNHAPTHTWVGEAVCSLVKHRWAVKAVAPEFRPSR